MIIQVRGTYGSGKSTVVRGVMDNYHLWNSYTPKGHRKPIWYTSEDFPHIGVAGRYETQCGGCDPIGAAPHTYDLVTDMLDAGIEHVLLEGAMISCDTNWTVKMMEWINSPEDLKILVLTTPPDECAKRIAGRRADSSRKVKKPLRLERINYRSREIEAARLRLLDAGAEVYRVHQRQAVPMILHWLRKFTK